MAVRVSRPCARTSNPGGTQWTPWVQRALLRAQLRVWETTASRVCRITYTKEREFLRSVEGPSRIWQHTERHIHVNKLRLGKAVSEKIGGKSAHHHSKAGKHCSSWSLGRVLPGRLQSEVWNKEPEAKCCSAPTKFVKARPKRIKLFPNTLTASQNKA